MGPRGVSPPFSPPSECGELQPHFYHRKHIYKTEWVHNIKRILIDLVIFFMVIVKLSHTIKELNKDNMQIWKLKKQKKQNTQLLKIAT